MQSLRIVAVGALTLATAFGALAITSAPAVAATSTRYVATTGSDGSSDAPNECTAKASPCKTLQHAVDVAGSGDTVSVAAGTYAQSVTVGKSLTLTGAGASKTTITGDPTNPTDPGVIVGNTIDPTSGSGLNVTLSGLAVSAAPAGGGSIGVAVAGARLTLDHGTVSGFDGGVYSIGGDVTITDSTVTHNTTYGVIVGPGEATGQGSVSILRSSVTANGVGIYSVGLTKMTVRSSTVSDNTSGGLYALGYLGGASPDSADSAVAVSNSTIQDNVGFGLALGPGSTTTVTGSTVSGTKLANDDGNGPVYADGVGAGIVVGGTLELSNSTISGNATQGVLDVSQSYAEEGDDGYAADVHISDSTIAQTQQAPTQPQGGNPFFSVNGALVSIDETQTETPERVQRKSASATPLTSLPAPRVWWLTNLGSGRSKARVASVHADAATPASPTNQVSVTGSIVAGSGKDVPACVGTITDGGYNLATDDSCAFSAKGSLSKTDPELGKLADNGGATQTQLPAAGSPAIDAIPSGKADCVSGATDQRGVARPRPDGGRCDMGAVEVYSRIVIHPASLPHGTAGTAYHATFTATGGADGAYVWSLAPGSSLPAGLHLTSTGVLSGTPSTAGTFHFTVSVNDPVLKAYTLTIAPAPAPAPAPTPTPTSTPAAPADNGSEPIASTGTHVTSMTALGAGGVFAGFLVLMGAGLVGRRRGRHRAAR